MDSIESLGYPLIDMSQRICFLHAATRNRVPSTVQLKTVDVSE